MTWTTNLQSPHIVSKITQETIPLISPEIWFRMDGTIITQKSLFCYSIIIQSFPVHADVEVAFNVIN